MAKKGKHITIGVVVGLLLTGTIIFLHRKRKTKKYKFEDLSSFIENPSKLNSPDAPNSWTEIDQELLSRLERLSKMYGRKLKVTSGYRSPAHNTSVGGATRSAHMSGTAVDIYTGSYLENINLGRMAKKLGFKRIGVGNSFIHLDLDNNLPIARWTYNGLSTTKVENDLGFA